MRWRLLFALSLLTVLNVAAQETRSELPHTFPLAGSLSPLTSVILHGQVVDATGTPVSGATVTISGNNFPTQVHSGVDGSFAAAIAPGTYEISASYGMASVSAMHQVMDGMESLTLRLPPGVRAGAGGASVSVATLALPRKARQAIEKAGEALARGNAAEVVQQADRALSLSPGSAQALTLRAIARMALHQQAAAEADLNTAIRADSNYALPYIILAASDNNAGRFDSALRLLSTAERLDPQRWQLHFEMARALSGKGDLRQAWSEVERGERLNSPPSFAALLLLKGQIARRLHLAPDALRAFQQFLKVAPHAPEAGHVRALVAQLRAGQ
jgi:Tfp pilus assembly protein PilF